MKPEIAKQLQELLDERDRQKQAETSQATAQQNAEAKNYADFEAKKDTLIRPAFQEIVDLYRAKGITLRIDEMDERCNTKGGTESPYIRLDMAEAYPPHTDMKPEFKLVFNKRNRSFLLYTATRSHAGPGGNVALDDVTADWIHTNFLKYQTGRSFM